MDRKDDMDLESLKNMLSDVPDTDEFDEAGRRAGQTQER